LDTRSKDKTGAPVTSIGRARTLLLKTLLLAAKKKNPSLFNVETEKLAVKFSVSPATVSSVGGLALLVFGLIMLLAAIGYVKPKEPLSLFGRAIGGAISVGMTAAGVWMLYRGALTALKNAGFAEGGFPTARSRRWSCAGPCSSFFSSCLPPY